MAIKTYLYTPTGLVAADLDDLLDAGASPAVSPASSLVHVPITVDDSHKADLDEAMASFGYAFAAELAADPIAASSRDYGVLAADPTEPAPSVGDSYFSTALTLPRFWNGAAWVSLSTGGGGGGDVVGPAGATDHALTRFDLATGKLIQNSVVTLDDSGNMAFPNAATINLGTSGRINMTAGSFIGAVGIDDIEIEGDDLNINDSGSVQYARFDGGARALVLNTASDFALDVHGGDIQLDDGEYLRWGNTANFVTGGQTSPLGGVFRQRGNGTGVTSRIVISPGVMARDWIFEPDGDLTVPDFANLRIQWRSSTSRTYIEGNTGAGDTTFATDDGLVLAPDTELTISPGGAGTPIGNWTSTGLKVGDGTVPTATLEVNEGSGGADQFRLVQSFTPTGFADAAGNQGNIAWDDSFLYVKVSTGWKRATLSAF